MARRRRKRKGTSILAAAILEAGFLLFLVCVAQPSLIKDLADRLLGQYVPSQFQPDVVATDQPVQAEPRIAVLPAFTNHFNVNRLSAIVRQAPVSEGGICRPLDARFE